VPGSAFGGAHSGYTGFQQTCGALPLSMKTSAAEPAKNALKHSDVAAQITARPDSETHPLIPIAPIL
jgi:hypothetical protein